MAAKRARKAAPERPLRIVELVEASLVPPDGATPEQAREAPWRTEYDVLATLRGSGHEVHVIPVGDDLGVVRNAIWEVKPHLAFNLLEGFDDVPGYDANVVAYLELLKQRYTGCNSRGLLLSRDKALAKKLLAWHRISVPHFAVVARGRRFKRGPRLPFPLIVKSLTLDASIGIAQASVVDSDAKLEERIKFVHDSLETDALVEQFVEGRELYVGVMGNERLQVLPVWELDFANMPESSHRIATSRLKWSEKYQKEHGIDSGPAKDLAPAVQRRIESLCKRAYRVLCLNGYARMDLRLSPDGGVHLLEANPNPQIAQGEDFADSAAAAGLAYPALLDRLLRLGQRWEPRRWS
jgi:D-alanine-D-alanine ligase